MGNTAAIQWRLMPEMSHTSEQLLSIRGTALNGQGVPLTTGMKEVKACVEGKKGFTLPPQTSLRPLLLALLLPLTARYAHIALVQNHSFMHRDAGSERHILRFATVSHIAAAAC